MENAPVVFPIFIDQNSFYFVTRKDNVGIIKS